MHKLGATRTRVTARHALIAPDGHVQIGLPGWTDTDGVILVSPQLGARFTHFLATMRPGAAAGAPLNSVERFVYVLEGAVELEHEGQRTVLRKDAFAYLPPDAPHVLRADIEASISVFERRYVRLQGEDPPNAVVSDLESVKGEPFLGDPQLICKKLLPDRLSFDMAVNTMTFEPGVTLPFVETHFMEHSLIMLSGGGIYRLGDDWYPVTAGDVLWMGPFCPQWFGALGRENASYLLYKEANRDVFALERES